MLGGNQERHHSASEATHESHLGNGSAGDGGVPAEAEAVLDWWYGDIASRRDPSYTHRYAFWFGRDHDDEIRSRFGALIARLGRDEAERERWCSTPQGTIAMIVVLDQLSRNVHRATPLMFQYDHICLAAARKLVRGGHVTDGSLTPPEVAHVAICLSHSEEEIDHELSLGTLYPALFASPTFPREQRSAFEGHMHMARVHAEEIRRFGRYPHRNELLGRESTPTEAAWLREHEYGYHRQTRK